MFETFTQRLLVLFRGGDDPERPSKVGHACQENVITIVGLVARLELVAAMHLLVDFWEQNCARFHKAMRSPSAFGAFEPPHLRHEMAVHACADTVWYAAARANPEAHQPKFYAFIGRQHGGYMTAEKRTSLIGRGAAFLQGAEASHLKWNAAWWTRSRHLLGVLTNGERAASFAGE